MRITVLTMGSRGDVQPLVALGVGLAAAGHRVTVCASARFGDFIARRGPDYAPMTDDVIRVVETDLGRRAVEHGGFSLRLLRRAEPHVRIALDEQWLAASDADAVVYHPYALAGPHIAERRNIPAVIAAPLPMVSPTGDFPSPLLPWLRLGRRVNWLSHVGINRAMNLAFATTIRRYRRDTLGLSSASRAASDAMRRHPPVLYGYSPRVVPTPADWPATTMATGNWFLDSDDDAAPSPALRAFLQAGPPPVYVGFGSMTVRTHSRERLTRVVVEALSRAGVRGILARGWGALAGTTVSEDVFAVETVSHRWLFPSVAAVVHHGSAGTTAAGLRAGRPNVVCPFVGDQAFWGQRLHALRVSPPPLPYRRITAVDLAERIARAVGDVRLRERAEALGAAIRAEDGIGRAVDVVNRWLGYGVT